MSKELTRVNVNLPVKTVSNFRQFVDQPAIQRLLAEAATKHLTPARLLSMVGVAISRTPRLALCTPLSILNGCLDAAQAGCVTIGGANARGYLVPYKNGRLSREAGQDVFEAQFQLSYLGMCDQARRSGEIAFVEAFPVFEGDEFSYRYGSNDPPNLVPSSDPRAVRTKDTLRFVYAIARYRTHTIPQFRVLGIGEIEEHRNRSRSANDGPWVTDYVAMALKTAIRVLCKWLPQTPEMLAQESREVETEFNRMPVSMSHIPQAMIGEERIDAETGEVLPTDLPGQAGGAKTAFGFKKGKKPTEEATEQPPADSGVPSEAEQAAIREREAEEAGVSDEPQSAPE